MSSADSTTGALLVGSLVSFWLFGIVTVQTYLYYERYPRDSRLVKALVGFVVGVETLQMCFTGHMIYYFAITERLETAGMRPKAWSFNSNTALTAIVAFSVQVFIAYRVWIINRVWWQRVCAVALACLALMPLACGIACTSIMVFIKHPALYAKCSVIIAIWISSTAFVDIALAGLLCLTLYNSRIGFEETNSMISRLIIMVINTAILTSGLALADLGTFFALGNLSLVHWALNMNLSKVYVNTLLATLNHRQTERERTPATVSSGTLAFARAPRRAGLRDGASSTDLESTDGDEALAFGARGGRAKGAAAFANLTLAPAPPSDVDQSTSYAGSISNRSEKAG